MDIEELLTFIKGELNGCPGYAFIDRCIGSLRREMESRGNRFQPDEFRKWFIEKNVIYRNSPLAFLAKCGIDDISAGKFDKEKIEGFDTWNFKKTLESKGISAGDDRDMAVFEFTELWLCNEGHMTLDELRNWNHQAVDYLADSGKTMKDLLSLFKRSKTMRAFKIPFAAIDAKADEEVRVWDGFRKRFEDLGKGKESETKENEEKDNQIDNQAA